MESYRYFSSPNPTVIPLEISSALLGSTCLILLVGLDDEFPFLVSIGRLVPACIIDRSLVWRCFVVLWR